MPPAVAAAGIVGAATVGSAVMGASASKKAAKKASKVSQQNTQANNALAREKRDFAFGVLDPYRQSGLRASSALSEMLLGPAPAATTPALGAATPTAPGAAAVPTEEWANGALNAMGLGSRGNSSATLRAHLEGRLEGAISPQMRQAYESYRASNPQATTPALQPATPPASGTVTTRARTAWDQFRDSTNYQFRFNEGMDALNQNLAFQGLGDSGAAVKEALKYGQNFASNELGNYMQLLSQQQQMGMGAASAMVGVGQNATGQIISNNNQAAGDAANASLLRGQATAGMWNGIAQGVGTAVGALGSSYGRSPAQPYPMSYSGAWGAGGV